MANAVLGWLQGLPPGEFAALAAAEAPMADRILGQYGPMQLALARTLLGPADRAALAQADDVMWEAMVDVVLARRPADGMVIWEHRPWFRRELAACRDRFLAG